MADINKLKISDDDLASLSAHWPNEDVKQCVLDLISKEEAFEEIEELPEGNVKEKLHEILWDWQEMKFREHKPLGMH